MEPLYIYNIFPKLYENIGKWEKELTKITRMGFNSIYINPIHYPGFSGSLYAPKEYYKYNPQFFEEGKSEEEQIKSFLNACKEKNIKVFIDLVVNHTSIDSPLIEEHKNWYQLDNTGDVKRPGAWENGKYVTWGDLAEFDLEYSEDKDNLWKYLYNMCDHFLSLGFDGFRCDAAYQVPEVFWEYLIPQLKGRHSEVLFLAETLGCTPVQIQSLANVGFDYIFNSSKWWNFHEPWCLEQYEMTRKIAPSISFPESHDTERLMNEVGGDVNAFLQRMYFEAVFSKGFMITSGFEYGFTKRINTVMSTPDDWEKTEYNFSKNIKKILEIKSTITPLHEESEIKIVDQANWQNIFCFTKEHENEKVLVILNKDAANEQPLLLDNIEGIIGKDKVKDQSPEDRIKGYIKKLEINLKAGEIKIFQ